MSITRSNLLLLLTALLWGGSFIFQKAAMDHMGPFSFNGFRFLLGGLMLLPLIGWRKGRTRPRPRPAAGFSTLFSGAALAGAVMFLGATLQQFGIQYTTVGNTGFITGLYIVFVPVIGLFFGHRYKSGIWLAFALACFGLYLLSGMDGFRINYGDFLVLVGAIFWAAHVMVIDHMSSHHDQIKTAAIQFFTCAALSYCAALVVGDRAILLTLDQWKWVIASGILAVGLGYTLQVIGQTSSPPAQAAVILSLESVFAAVAGYFYYDEILGPRALIGCGLMFAGCLLAQRYPPLATRPTALAGDH